MSVGLTEVQPAPKTEYISDAEYEQLVVLFAAYIRGRACRHLEMQASHPEDYMPYGRELLAKNGRTGELAPRPWNGEFCPEKINDKIVEPLAGEAIKYLVARGAATQADADHDYLLTFAEPEAAIKAVLHEENEEIRRGAGL